MGQDSLSVVIHGHFYQPPREDPWMELVPPQPAAAPWHDWNERIERECYRAVVASRLLDRDGRILSVLNTLAHISFNVGPTLLAWLERRAPRTYERILAADQASLDRLGHGNALAMPYNHPILPLSDERDRTTEVRWGIADFRRRFGRAPEGMWLPETAVDDATLDALAGEGIRFTILAPHQVTGAPEDGSPGRYVTENGREIALFVYDGGLSHAVAFGDLLKDGTRWADRFVERAAARRLRSMATDGETFGHHQAFGEMALATVIDDLGSRAGVTLENFASYLERHPATAPVGLVAPSSWSCSHGVERWQSACGCRSDTSVDSDQSWRGPLRAGLRWLAGELHSRFESQAASLLGNPWAAREAYGSVADATDPSARDDFLGEWAGAALDRDQRARALELLEMERNALRLFTSCAWFFDDVAGIEARQVLAYAARAVELSGEAAALEAGLLERLAAAPSNDAEVGSGDRVYLQVRPSSPRPVQAAVAAALTEAYAAGRPSALFWGAYATRVQGERVQVDHQTTTRTWDMRVTLSGATLAEASARVAPAAGAPVTPVGWDELPALWRELVAEHLVHAVLRGDGEGRPGDLREHPAGLLQGRRPRLIAELHRALLEGLEQIERRELVAAAAERVTHLLDAMVALAEAVPYDAETRLWELSAEDGTHARALDPIRRRLAFSRAR